MKATTRTAFAALIGAALLSTAPTQPSLQAEEVPAPKTLPTSKQAWTLDEALTELKLHPHDPYLQYVALQLARRAGKFDEIHGQVVGEGGNGRPDRRSQVDLFSMFAGALAVQESLQLDTMRTGQGGSGTQGATAPGAAVAPHGSQVALPPGLVESSPLASAPTMLPPVSEQTADEGISLSIPGVLEMTFSSQLAIASSPSNPAPSASPTTGPTLPTSHYLKHPPQYLPPTTPYAQPRELANTTDAARPPTLATNNLQQVSGTTAPAATPSAYAQLSSGGTTALTDARKGPEATRTQIRFTRPARMKITCFVPDAESKSPIAAAVDIPGRCTFPQAGTYESHLTVSNKRGCMVLPVILEVPAATAKTEAFLAQNAVPVAFTDQDIDRVKAGKGVVKVISLSGSPAEEAEDAVTERVFVTRGPEGPDPAGADADGRVLLVVRMGDPEQQRRLHATITAVTPTTKSTPAAPVPLQGAPPPAAAPAEATTTDAPQAEAQKTEPEQQEAAEARRKEILDISTLNGPTIKSHPWKKMLGKKDPEVARLARCVPTDFYFVEFHSLTKLLDLLDTADQWGTFIYSQSVHDARSQKVGDRLQKQLALESSALLRPFYGLVVEEVAITGSDLFIREGSDVTLLFQYKQEKLFKDRMAGFLADAAKANPNARKTTATLLGVDYVHLATPDRAVSVFACYPEPGLHVRTNSKVALRRVLEAIQGKTASGRTVRRLGDTAEFKYIRTLMPRGAQEEDGFIYLSDPFVRHMVGPRLKLTERRRLLAYNHLRMIGHAAQMYRTEFGKAPASLDDLEEAECAPGKFNEGELAAPDGGRYELTADGNGGVCARHGTVHFLTPCCEIPVKEITGEEADLYDAFRKNYDEYWRTYFDPIALRVQVTGKRMRLETIVLPMIDNTVYAMLAKVLGGETEHLDALPVPKRNLFSVNVRINREGLLKEFCERDPATAKAVKLMLGDQAESASLGVMLLAYCLHESAASAPAAMIAADLQALPSLGSIAGSFMESKELGELVISGGRFLLRGLGTQVGLHVYDQGVPFDLNLASLLGQAMGAFNGSDSRALGAAGVMMVAVPVAACTAPGYLSFTVQDEKIVDDFLNKLDKVLPPLLRQYSSGVAGLPIEPDYYKVKLKGGAVARSFTLRIGPARLRVHWARIGKGLYLTNQLGVLEDLQVAEAKMRAEGQDRGPKAHAMVRMRPRNWDQALPGFTLSWAENNRQACLRNLGPLSGAARALSAAPPGGEAPRTASWDDRARRVVQHAQRVFGTHCCCPDGGRYVVAEDGKTMTCSVHGSVIDSRQGTAPAANSSTARLMRGFDDLTAAVTFTKEGLRAVVTIDRK